ncbi:RluA family pseudouridine synthase [bacterium]|nr:RluA family pseudouridine synthase [bacterium]
MEKKFSFTFENIGQKCRLDSFLSGQAEFLSRSKVQKLIDNNQVRVNGNIEKASYKLKTDDVVEVSLSDDLSFTIEGENIPLDIVYEDDNLIVINKPKQMLTHPTSKELTGTLVNALLYRYGYEGLSDINGILRPGIVHRLDRDTSGLIMVAKNNFAHNYLAEGIKNKTIVRKYISVVNGVFSEETGIIDKPIGRSFSQPKKMAIVEGGKPSVTLYRVLETFKAHSLIELNLKTGRTHQIRVHMASINHPVVNDSLYTGLRFKVTTTGQVLQSYKLTFAKPDNNDIINLELEYDSDVKRVLNCLRSLK